MIYEKMLFWLTSDVTKQCEGVRIEIRGEKFIFNNIFDIHCCVVFSSQKNDCKSLVDGR